MEKVLSLFWKFRNNHEHQRKNNRTIDSLSEPELRQVAEYLSFLRFRSRVQRKSSIGEKKLAELYAQFSDDDRQLAEEGIEDYNRDLLAEDNKLPPNVARCG